MNHSDIQHRFANKLEGKYGRICAGNVRYEGRNYYSYYTVFGQWVDISKNVVVIFDGSTSTSSSGHKLHKGYFPDDVHVFPLDFGSKSHYGWRNCNLVSAYSFNDEDFTFEHRMRMIDHYVERIYDQIAAINGGKKKGLENVDFSAWNYVVELCGLYRDTSIPKYYRWVKDHNRKQLVRVLNEGVRDVQAITNYLFGDGTFESYIARTERFRKADKKRKQMEALCERLGISSPYESYCRGRMDSGLTADQIRKLTAKERIELHFKALAYKEYNEHEEERNDKYNRNFRNAYKWIVGFEPKERWRGYDNDVYNNCVNKDSGVVYECSGGRLFGFYWCDTDVSFDYDDFRKSEDKEQWIATFYAECKEVADNRKAIGILKRINAHKKEKEHSYDADAYINDDYLRENTSPSEYILCSHFIYLQDKHFADEEARRRAMEIERIRREEEERKEREYMESVKKEQIAACVQEGADGCRNLWRNHLTDSFEAERYFENVAHGDFFMGGNVLLRFNLNKDRVETSKNIRMPIAVAKKFFGIIKKWHENPSSFKPIEIDTKGSGRYTISAYMEDILTAGCHKIAYAEMERMYNDILKLEAAA